MSEASPSTSTYIGIQTPHLFSGYWSSFESTTRTSKLTLSTKTQICHLLLPIKFTLLARRLVGRQLYTPECSGCG